jgi:hypothetical protein
MQTASSAGRLAGEHRLSLECPNGPRRGRRRYSASSPAATSLRQSEIQPIQCCHRSQLRQRSTQPSPGCQAQGKARTAPARSVSCRGSGRHPRAAGSRLQPPWTLNIFRARSSGSPSRMRSSHANPRPTRLPWRGRGPPLHARGVDASAMIRISSLQRHETLDFAPGESLIADLTPTLVPHHTQSLRPRLTTRLIFELAGSTRPGRRLWEMTMPFLRLREEA